MEELQNGGAVDEKMIVQELLDSSVSQESLLVENARLRAEMVASAERMERLQALIAGLGRAVTREEAFAAVVGEGMRAFEATTATVTLLSEDGTSLEINHS